MEASINDLLPSHLPPLNVEEVGKCKVFFPMRHIFDSNNVKRRGRWISGRKLVVSFSIHDQQFSSVGKYEHSCEVHVNQTCVRFDQTFLCPYALMTYSSSLSLDYLSKKPFALLKVRGLICSLISNVLCP